MAASSGIHHLRLSGSAIDAKSSQETSPRHPACSAMRSSCRRVPGVFFSVKISDFFNEQIKWEWSHEPVH